LSNQLQFQVGAVPRYHLAVLWLAAALLRFNFATVDNGLKELPIILPRIILPHDTPSFGLQANITPIHVPTRRQNSANCQQMSLLNSSDFCTLGRNT
jgi:hypothetical protein